MVFRRTAPFVLALAVLLGGLAVPAPAVAAGPTAIARTGGVPLNVRSGASTVDPTVRTVPSGTRLTVVCQVYGQRVSGAVRRTAHWYRVTAGGYVAAGNVRWSPRRPAVPWCASARPTAAVASTAGGPLNVRVGARTGTRLAGTVRNGSRLTVRCRVWGEQVGGPVRTSSTWYRLAPGRHVSAGYVRWRPAAPYSLPWCGQAPPTVPPADAAAFLARVAGPAQQNWRRHRVPASVTIAQAILESGWARSGLTRRDHNYFGIKCFGHPGTIALGCRGYATYECEGNRCYRTSAQFRAYRNAAGSFADHGHFLRVNPRYRPAFAHTHDPERFAREIHKAGYATAPTYATNLIKIMRQYDLYRYDR